MSLARRLVVGGIHPAGAGFLRDLRAFVASEKTRAPEPLEWRDKFNTRV